MTFMVGDPYLRSRRAFLPRLKQFFFALFVAWCGAKRRVTDLDPQLRRLIAEKVHSCAA